MEELEKAIEVQVPVRTAYNQWTQFEEFPRFMEGVESVTQLEDDRLHWVASIGGKTKEWDARITHQVPDQRVAWVSEDGPRQEGSVTFQPQGDDKTQVALRIEYEPEGLTDNVGDKLGFVTRRVEGDLERFKEFIEARGVETGAWRGRIGDR
jgi:uncharacterized membrane protein